jgi:hypothetical protein
MRLHPHFPYTSFVPQPLGAFCIQSQELSAHFHLVVLDDELNYALFDATWNGYAQCAPAQ